MKRAGITTYKIMVFFFIAKMTGFYQNDHLSTDRAKNNIVFYITIEREYTQIRYKLIGSCQVLIPDIFITTIEIN